MAGKLPHKIQLFIVEQLACYETPTDTTRAVKDAFKREVSRQQVEYYDPTKRLAANGLTEQLREHFWTTRKSYNDESAENVRSLNYRLGILNFMIMRLLAKGNFTLVAQFLEQAAKDEGGAFTNRREHSGPSGGPIKVNTYTPEEWKKERAHRLARAEATLAKFKDGGVD